jgi:hypothetical protein
MSSFSPAQVRTAHARPQSLPGALIPERFRGEKPRLRFSPGLCLALCALAVFVPAGHARPEKAGQNAEARFTAMDANRDGRVSREEFFAALPTMKEAAFAAIDEDGDGFLTLQEWNSFATGHGREDAQSGDNAPPVSPRDRKTPELLLPPAKPRESAD